MLQLSEQADGDEGLLAAAKEGIANLNEHYGPAPGGDRFLLLHRRRTWAASEGRWIGWERKRGKLTEPQSALARRPGYHVPGAARAARRRSLRNHLGRGHAAPAGDY